MPVKVPPTRGLKPADAVDSGVLEADKALASGTVDNLVKLINEETSKGIRERFNKAKRPKNMRNTMWKPDVNLWKPISSLPIMLSGCISMSHQ